MGFAVGKYDRSRPLVIDPVLVYSSFLGGSGSDAAWGIAVDAAGNLYAAGATRSSDFPTTAGALQTTHSGADDDAFVVKLSPTGAMLFATYLGGKGSDYSYGGVAVDSAGNAYITGATNSTDFPITPGAYKTTTSGRDDDAFVTKLDPRGGLVYSTYLGVSIADGGACIAVDGSGSAYVTGKTADGLPTTDDAPQKTFGGGFYDAFVAKLNPNGAGLLFATYLGGNGVDRAKGIAVDAVGNVVVTGTTRSSDFPTTSGAFQPRSGGGYDAFAAKIDTTVNGSARLVYATYLGGGGDDTGQGIALDAAGFAYVTGDTASSSFPTTAGAIRSKLVGTNAAYVTKLSADGSALAYSTLLCGAVAGGTSALADFGLAIAIDPSGSAFVTGATTAADFPTTANGFRKTYQGGYDAFLTKLNPTGTALLYSTYLCGDDNEMGRSVAADGRNNVYVAGWTASSNFPTTTASIQGGFGGGLDAFVMKFQLCTRSDFNNDGKSDFLWQNQETGAVRCWFMDGAGLLTESAIVESSDPDWKIVATADLNGDCRPDLIWQYSVTGAVAYWIMDGTRFVSSGYLYEGGNPDWKVVGAADLNDDGKPDLLWHNRVSGAVAYWLLRGTAFLDSGTIVEEGGADWRVVAVGDLDNDGKPDLLWQNQATGEAVYWLLDGTKKGRGDYLVRYGNPDWKIMGLADLTGDNQLDLLWQHQVTGAVVYWRLERFLETGGGWILDSEDTRWTIAGLR